MATSTNKTKNTSVFINKEKTGKDETWDEADYSWDESQGSWVKQFSVFLKRVKNIASFSNQAKN